MENEGKLIVKPLFKRLFTIIIVSKYNNNNINSMTTPEFLEDLQNTFNECIETAKRKNADYAGVGDPFKNFKNVEVLGICSVEVGILTRMTDKMSRISNLIKQEAQVKDESIKDTLQDLINYAAILKAYLK